MATRTITLTGRPPVQIDEDSWPVIASAREKEWDNEYEFQANRTEKISIHVRQHADGRAIVYAAYSYDTQFANERDAETRHGILLPAGSDLQAVCEAIQEVASSMPAAQMFADGVWDRLAAECIADLPAETLE